MIYWQDIKCLFGYHIWISTILVNHKDVPRKIIRCAHCGKGYTKI